MINKLTIEIEPVEEKKFELRIVAVIADKGPQTYLATVPTADGKIFGYGVKAAIERGITSLTELGKEGA